MELEHELAAASAALAAHRETAGLEPDNGPEVDLWHLLISLIAYCDRHGLDFDATLASARSEMGERA